MTPQISLIIPSIRPSMYQGVYDSFLQCWHGTFEIIFVCPHKSIPMNVTSRGDVRFIEDYGCPSRALQIGAINAKSDLLSFATDDCIFDSDTMNKAYRTYQKRNDYKTFITLPYTESDSWSKWMLTPFYYLAWFHAGVRHWNIPPTTVLYMYGLISKKLFIELGGFDTKYESMALTYVDLSIRMKLYGCHGIIGKERICHCKWQDKENSDHSPVHHACVDHDIPLLKGIYFDRKFKPVIKIPVDNWQQVAARWPRRFKQ